jgi:SAM-dependent methyltransferase
MLTPARAARGIRLRARVVRHRGNVVLCPVCDSPFDCFADAWNRPKALCWRCGSAERHRALWLTFERRPELLAGARSLLHFAPEWALRRRLARIPALRYVTTDLSQAGVDMHLDVTALDLPDASFDAVLCSHVLEHVVDDAAAMRELRRVTAPGGWCIAMVPLDPSRDRTYEDPAIVTPHERERAFLQHDHVRFYGTDFGERLANAGFDVTRIEPSLEFGARTIERCGLLEADFVWLCRPD